MKKQKSYFRWIFRKIFSFSFLASPGKLVPLANWQSSVSNHFQRIRNLVDHHVLFDFHLIFMFVLSLSTTKDHPWKEKFIKNLILCWSHACRITLLFNPITFFQLHSISLSFNMIEGPTRRRFVQCRRFLGSCIDIVVCLVFSVWNA